MSSVVGTLKHKEWRKIAKRERRRKIRQKAAQLRDAEEEELKEKLQNSEDYKQWTERQEKEENERIVRDKEEHEKEERLWLEREVESQKEWRIQQERKAKAARERREQEEKLREEFSEKQEAIKREKERKKLAIEEEIHKQEELELAIGRYIEEGSKTPEALRLTRESQPSKEPCPFFGKTGSCRYGDTCSRNHKKLALSRFILIPGFYYHFSLEKNNAEYDTDITLEFEGNEVKSHFREFYKDVLPELEEFGKIKVFKCCCNSEAHLRGNVYIEYSSEREAARALRQLNGRWYAGRQLQCEFVNLQGWRNALCGMRSCPKGRRCNFLHTFPNPYREYESIESPPRRNNSPNENTNSQRRDYSTRSSTWNDVMHSENEGVGRHWRWSESPEPKSNTQSKDSDKRQKVLRKSQKHNKRSHRESSESDRSYKGNSLGDRSKSERSHRSRNSDSKSERSDRSRRDESSEDRRRRKRRRTPEDSISDKRDSRSRSRKVK